MLGHLFLTFFSENISCVVLLITSTALLLVHHTVAFCIVVIRLHDIPCRWARSITPLAGKLKETLEQEAKAIVGSSVHACSLPSGVISGEVIPSCPEEVRNRWSAEWKRWSAEHGFGDEKGPLVTTQSQRVGAWMVVLSPVILSGISYVRTGGFSRSLWTMWVLFALMALCYDVDDDSLLTLNLMLFG